VPASWISISSFFCHSSDSGKRFTILNGDTRRVFFLRGYRTYLSINFSSIIEVLNKGLKLFGVSSFKERGSILWLWTGLGNCVDEKAN